MKKKQTKQVPKIAAPQVIEKPKQNFKLLISIPATKTEHLQYQPWVLEAIKKAAEGYTYDLDIGEANESGWQFVVDQMNRVADKVVKEGYDYVLIVESDVVIAPNALSHMLTVDTDVVHAIVPWHRYPENMNMDELYQSIICAAWFVNWQDPQESASLHFESLHMDDAKDKILTFKDGPLEAGTGCILIKRRVFESGIRFVCKFYYASFDVYFWKDLHKQGFNGALDGFVVCEHLGT